MSKPVVNLYDFEGAATLIDADDGVCWMRGAPKHEGEFDLVQHDPANRPKLADVRLERWLKTRTELNATIDDLLIRCKLRERQRDEARTYGWQWLVLIFLITVLTVLHATMWLYG